MSVQLKLIPAIWCSGAGSRLWPVSRELHPKPFIPLADEQRLRQKAWLRGAALPDVAEALSVTNRELFFKTEDEYREVAGTSPWAWPTASSSTPLDATLCPLSPQI
jgi:mannose-1-phosphate guanylyltransferase/mannose-6-phosphate isomerase